MLFESTKQITGYHLSRSTFYVVAFYHVNQLPFLNNAIDGDEGGKGSMCFLASSTAALSFPAKTVIIRSGLTSDLAAAMAAGRAEPAAQPQTEFTTTKVVPCAVIEETTSSGVFVSVYPLFASSARMGAIISSGYIFYMCLY